MRPSILLSLTVFALTACVPVSVTPLSLAQAQADIAGDMAATGTAERAEDRQATATAWAQSSEATRIYIEQLHADATATQSVRETGIAATSTSAYSTGTAIVTEQAISKLATEQADMLTRQAFTNRINAERIEAETREKDLQRYSNLWFNASVCGLIVALTIALMLTFFLGSKWLPPVITALGENRSRIIVARGIGQSLNGHSHNAILTNMPTERGGVPDMSVKIIKSHAAEPGAATTPDVSASLELSHLHPDNRDVLRGIQHMAELVGGHSDMLPSSAKRIEAGLYNEVYQPIVNALSKSNDVGAREGKSGIFVNILKWRDLDDLSQGIMDGRVDVSNRVMWNGQKRPG